MKRRDESSMMGALLSLRGNARACVYTEPLWGIPYNLFSPYATLYMYSLSIGDAEIGLLLSIGLVIQLFTSLAGGVLADKFGRRRTTFISDLIAWSAPSLLWALAQDFRWFLAAVVLNSSNQISNTAWQCTLVEDADQDKLVMIYNWVHISGLLAVFFAPISGVLIGRYSLIPVMRGLYIFTFISMTAKFVILYFCSTETKQGMVRMRESRGESLSHMMLGYKDVFFQAVRNPDTVRALAISAISNICFMVSGNFFSIYVTQNLQIPEIYIALFPIVRAVVMLLFFFGAQRAFAAWSQKTVLLSGLGLFTVGQILLLLTGTGGLVMLMVYTVVDACAGALFLPRRDMMVVNDVDPAERARIMSIIFLVTLGVSSPFGYWAGKLSEMDRRLPFALNLVLFLVMIALVLREKNGGKNAVPPASIGESVQ